MDIIVRDKYGYDRCRGGEIVILNSDSYFCVGKNGNGWDDVFENQSTSPYSIAILAHPQIIAWSPYGMYGFRLDKYNTERHEELIKYVEIGNGGIRASNEINELVYSTALDNGFYVSTTCSSDSHGPQWGYHRFPGKTVIMASERSREAFFDAINNNRMYGTESGNVKLRYTVNGKAAPADLDYANTYRFHVELSYFTKDEMTVPVECAVISDGGKTLLKTTNISSSFDFEIQSDTARYFYLRFVDSEGKRTWSMPVWTGRKFDKYTDALISRTFEVDSKYNKRDAVICKIKSATTEPTGTTEPATPSEPAPGIGNGGVTDNGGSLPDA
jgi:hypothetical protein